mmetsp:Transcript_60382/g.127950  ORF Transcript_60382/g.127950 Transcript_60382/m.127950 type:complete len:273 (+) Transcript_60382:732-1550(+)
MLQSPPEWLWPSWLWPCPWPWPSSSPWPLASALALLASASRSAAALSISNAPTPRMASKGTLEYSESWRGACGLMPRILCTSRSRSSGVTISILLTINRSAKATCLAHSFTSFLSFFSSFKCCMQYLLSTTVTIASNCIPLSRASSSQKIDANGPGSAKPVVSMRMLSKPSRCTSTSRAETRSSRTEQQTQPFASSTQSAKTSPFGPVTPEALGASTPASPASSFWMTAILRPWSSPKMCFNKVVFPLPKKPVTIVTGVGAFSLGASSTSML